ncbi:hypothetical protein QBC34DRAFT_415191 [Podospora aff. communis PSN243]|uniref:Serine protease n=1 Tax=Podospora aff. communis PSN243 TaxID=3040156 RepID=A0AAV9G9D0_9PEZI|nr:hypothetical protein QBC34DRAFT_415191 [Podospora aff. communis PSN243]
MDSGSASSFTPQPTRHLLSPDVADMIKIGHVVFSSASLDYCLVELDSGTNITTSSTQSGLLPEPDTPVLISPDGKPQVIERVGRATGICLLAGRSGIVRGRLQGFSHDVKLPLSDEFQPIYTVRLDSPLRNGDSGSMVRDAATGGVFGYIIAVNQAGNTAMVMPIAHVLDSIQEAVNQGMLLP